MAELWYYTKDGKPMAAVATAEIQRLARDGSLKRTDMVWREGFPAWIRAGTVPEIFAGPLLGRDQATVTFQPSPRPAAQANPSAESAEQPILLEPIQQEPIRQEPIRRAERQNEPAAPAGTKRRRWDGEGEPNIAVRRPRRDRQAQMLVLWIGLLAGGGLLLLVLVLGLLYMTLNAL
jgi:hypothetical protein